MMRKLIFCLVLINQLNSDLFAQRNVTDSILSTPWVAFHYGGNQTFGDLNERFGYLSHVGFLAGYKTNKNWLWAVDANFHFGNKINIDDPLVNLADSKGNITDQNGSIGIVTLSARGFNVNLAAGKLFPVFNSNLNSGILVHAGAGFLAYKMRIDTPEQVIPQIETDYKKGYDRYSSGLNTHQFIGYAFMANKGFFNIYAGFYFQQGFTKNRRTIFFDQPDMPVSTDTRLDLQAGFKVGWMLPVYKRQPKEFYFD